MDNNSEVSINIDDKGNLRTPLSAHESSYRLKIQKNLNEYLDIWNLIDNIWHLKPMKFEYLNLWKSDQEKEMLLRKGTLLKNKNLSNFLRMLNVSLPQSSFDDINSDVLLLLNQDRKLIKVELNS